MSKVKSPISKAYPSIKTIILREQDVKTQSQIPGEIPGVWSRNLDEEVLLKDGDEIMIKSSFVDTSPTNEGFITITDDEIDQLSLTTGLYWQDSGEGVDIQRFASSIDGGKPTYNPGLQQVDNGPLPHQSQVLQSEGTITTPNGRNYICQNTLDQFNNTILYLNTASADQDGGGAVATLTSGTGVPETQGSLYTTEKNLPVANLGAGEDLRVDIVATPIIPGIPPALDTGGLIESITINTAISSGRDFSVGSQIRPSQPNSSGGGLNQSAETFVSTLRSDVPMAVEFVPNPQYNPTSATHEYYDYTMKDAADNSTAFVQAPNTPPQGGFTTSKLDSVANISQLAVSTDPEDSTIMYIYSNRFSTTFDWTTPPDNKTNHIATITQSLVGGVAEFTFERNNNWNQDRNLPGGVSDIGQGWWFIGVPKITFNGGNQTSFYRLCLGMWLWVWSPGAKGGTTFPVEGKQGSGTSPNNYAVNLHYYRPGTATGVDGQFTKSVPAMQPKLWDKIPKGNDNMYSLFKPQFESFCDFNRAGIAPKTTPDSGYPAPESQFPKPQPPEGGRRSEQSYPMSGTNGTCVPCWFSNMPDTSSDDPGVSEGPTWKPFLYDSNPQISTAGSDPDAGNFQPFRVTSGGSLANWTGGKNEMKGYPFCGIVQQDVRGPIMNTDIGGIPDPGPKPGVWTTGPQSKETTAPIPPFQLTHACVLSRPYIPSNGIHMTARTYKTVLKDIPSGNVGGIESTLRAGTYTYSEWARILTDTLNRIPPRRTPAAGVGFNGLSNNPDNSKQSLNAPTYTSSRFLTDTVELGYQGLQFPSNRVGLEWDQTPPVKIVDANNVQTGTAQSEQPYWLAESAGDIFKWKDGVPDQVINADSAQNATVDPQDATNPATDPQVPSSHYQLPNVYGLNGPKFAGAESFSIIYNEVSQAFEIVQMHSNMYDASSGAIITRQFQSGFKGVAYPKKLGEMSIADQDGGIFITDWAPLSVWTGKMNFSPNTLVHVGGDFSGGGDMQRNSFADASVFPGLSSVAANPITLSRGLNITGNFRSTTGLIDRRVNVPSASGQDTIADFIGGSYASVDVNYDLQVETTTPITVLGKTITPPNQTDPFFMIELSGANTNSMFGMRRENSLISQIVGRYFSVGSYTQGNADGSITYTHRGEPLLLSELGIRILDSGGQLLPPTVLNPASAVVIEISSQDVSLIEEE